MAARKRLKYSLKTTWQLPGMPDCKHPSVDWTNCLTECCMERYTVCVLELQCRTKDLQCQGLISHCGFKDTRPARFQVNRDYHPYVKGQHTFFIKHLVLSSVNTVLRNSCCSLNPNIYLICLPLSVSMYPLNTEIQLMVDLGYINFIVPFVFQFT
jgi:hypothetical protein